MVRWQHKPRVHGIGASSSRHASVEISSGQTPGRGEIERTDREARGVRGLIGVETPSLIAGGEVEESNCTHVPDGCACPGEPSRGDADCGACHGRDSDGH